MTSVSHLLLAVNASVNLLLYCFCDKHFWVITQKKLKMWFVWPFTMRQEMTMSRSCSSNKNAEVAEAGTTDAARLNATGPSKENDIEVSGSGRILPSICQSASAESVEVPGQGSRIAASTKNGPGKPVLLSLPQVRYSHDFPNISTRRFGTSSLKKTDKCGSAAHINRNKGFPIRSPNPADGEDKGSPSRRHRQLRNSRRSGRSLEERVRGKLQAPGTENALKRVEAIELQERQHSELSAEIPSA